MPIEIVEGDLLAAPESILVQQCCCTAVRPHGLSAAISERLGADPYSLRRAEGRRNCAIAEDRPAPGSVLLLPTAGGDKQVACLFGQYAMGRPGRYHADHGVPDSASDREGYFNAALDALAAAIPPTAHIAFPYNIGCGLAGGDWVHYWGMLYRWSARNPALHVRVSRLNGVT